MPSEPRRASKKTLKLHHRTVRRASSDAHTRSESQRNSNTRPAKGLRVFWRRRRTVTPAGLRSFVVAEHQSTMSSPARLSNDPNDNIVFLNNPTEFDLRSYLFKRRRSHISTDRLERSAISQNSVSSRRSQTAGITSTGSFKGEAPFDRKAEAMESSVDVLTTKQTGKLRRRLRAKEELCIVFPRSTTCGRTRSQKSWFLGPGFIGRDPGVGTLVVTKDQSMDTVHAEISVAGDDYFVHDTHSTMGTFLCLSTHYRHYPQRDGFRLCRGDVFRIGPATSIRVLDLQTTTETTFIRTTRSRSSSISSLTTTEQSASKPASSGSQTADLERTSSTSNNSGGNAQTVLKRMSTVEELRLLAADIEDELMNDAGRIHPGATPRNGSGSVSKDNTKGKISARPKPQHIVHFADTPPMMSDGSVFLGSRYLRPEVKELHYCEPSQVEDAEDDTIKQLVGCEHEPPPTENSSPNIRRAVSIRLVIFQHDPANASAEPLKPREVTLPGQGKYLIGSSAACDVQIFPSEGIEIRAVHARILFDGTSFVLQDVSFERDPRRQTRVLLTQRPVRVTRGDWLLLGKCALYITTLARAFGSARRPDMKEAAMRLDILRLSKRKPRTRGLFVPVGFRLHSSSGSGASSGSTGWGGSSGGPVTFGKGRDCDAQVFTASLATEQFSVQLERGTCLLTPTPTGINAGTYFLIGRDEPEPPFLEGEGYSSGDTETFKSEVVKHTSKPLLLSEGCVFRCGGCEVEVIYSKSASASNAKSTPAIEEQENIRFLSAMPWLKPIVSDLKTIANVARCGQRLKLGPGELIYERGDAANFLFIVITGEVALHIILGHDEHERDDSEMLTEMVTAGGYFGEESLHDTLELYASTPNSDDHEYPETARAASVCELLALAREDVCGYLGLYMDIVRAHLHHDRCRDKIISVACSRVPWLRGISLHEMRLLSSQAEIAVYPPGAILFEDGKLFVPAAFAGGNTFQLRDGILVLSRGDVRVVRSKHERQHRRFLKVYHADVEEKDLESEHDVDEETKNSDEWWSPMEPVLALSWSSSPCVSDQSFRLEASSTVECYFVASVHLAHLNVDIETKQHHGSTFGPEASSATQAPLPLKRGNSFGPRRMHHSQVVTSALHSGEHSHGDDDDLNSMDGSDGEGDNTAARRWRHKKRNKHLLEQTVLEIQNDTDVPNALVLYVLAGPQRGDIHVVRNVASIGGFLSGADIELNDRYISPAHAVIEYHEGRYWLYDNCSKWGTFVRLEEENAVDINPGDVFLAGEVEFTCLASYPERNKPSMCCVM